MASSVAPAEPADKHRTGAGTTRARPGRAGRGSRRSRRAGFGAGARRSRGAARQQRQALLQGAQSSSGGGSACRARRPVRSRGEAVEEPDDRGNRGALRRSARSRARRGWARSTNKAEPLAPLASSIGMRGLSPEPADPGGGPRRRARPPGGAAPAGDEQRQLRGAARERPDKIGAAYSRTCSKLSRTRSISRPAMCWTRTSIAGPAFPARPHQARMPPPTRRTAGSRTAASGTK